MGSCRPAASAARRTGHKSPTRSPAPVPTRSSGATRKMAALRWLRLRLGGRRAVERLYPAAAGAAAVLSGRGRVLRLPDGQLGAKELHDHRQRRPHAPVALRAVYRRTGRGPATWTTCSGRAIPRRRRPRRSRCGSMWTGSTSYGCRTGSWEQKSYTITGSGPHTLKWLAGRYTSDWSGTGYVDYVQWTGSAAAGGGRLGHAQLPLRRQRPADRETHRRPHDHQVRLRRRLTASPSTTPAATCGASTSTAPASISRSA